MSTDLGYARLSEATFDAIAALTYRESGLKLVPEKILLVQSRLRHRLRALDISNFDHYCDLVKSRQGWDERRYMISALTTNVSHFFRESHHFDLLSKQLVPKLTDHLEAGQRIRIWSAGCSNGQEPYSIAMHLLGVEPRLADADFKILATDIDPNVIGFARRGQYDARQSAEIPDETRVRFLEPRGTGLTPIRIPDEVKTHVVFHELNLLTDWPMKHAFDAIFCRNVVIYFDLETQRRLWPRFERALKPDGQFFLGHSERITDAAAYGFKSIGPTAYAKTGTRV
ncbi:protein-glutamate O-methyltransferase [uncultured Tateyamaria sp.]|uniref:CheR family methyltransferase n=1 Tax=uncultured Tateyamaria sp. TaxID=455651 RepID=UPI002632DF55|nr:protein-glutamate O-methyltransferase [uncultured Tateyamaria sp.]